MASQLVLFAGVALATMMAMPLLGVEMCCSCAYGVEGMGVAVTCVRSQVVTLMQQNIQPYLCMHTGERAQRLQLTQSG